MSGMVIAKFQVGDVVEMKKIHPCGGWEWEILRTGVDFRLRCRKCGRMVLLPRPKFLKGVKSVQRLEVRGLD
jgi:hypothetical protein